ncbi:MAG: hypothetical protein RSD26_04085 [Cellulosilyticaceae bacterium]
MGEYQVAVTAKHKKAREFRDFLISSNSINMFKEEEINNSIIFRSVYQVREDAKKQFMIIIDDSVYIHMQSLILSDIPEERTDAMLRVLNELHFEYPTVKYVLTKEGHIMTSMAFHATEKSMDPSIIVMCTIEFFKTMSKDHYDRLLAVLA